MKSFIASAAVLGMASTSMAAAIGEFAPSSSRGARWINETELYERQAPADPCNSDEFFIQIQSTISTWYYQFTGIWGSDTGAGTSFVGGICVPADDGPGGALYFGPDPSPNAGSTKLECKFPTTGQANCDISLVDGYSLSMICQAQSNTAQTIGGGVDLYTTGTACPDQAGANCLNSNGGSATSQDQINAFFQPAVQNGNNYCIWADCSQDYYFTATDGITCTVSGTSE